MALPDYTAWEFNTPITFAGSGGDEPLTLTSLASGSARASDSYDLGADCGKRIVARLVFDMNSAPTAGESAEFYAVFGTGATSGFPGAITGSDAAWPSDGNEDEHTALIGPPSGFLIATNDATQQTSPWFEIPVQGQYIVFVVDNNLGVAASSTAANSYIEMAIIDDKIVDGAP